VCPCAHPRPVLSLLRYVHLASLVWRLDVVGYRVFFRLFLLSPHRSWPNAPNDTAKQAATCNGMQAEVCSLLRLFLLLLLRIFVPRVCFAFLQQPVTQTETHAHAHSLSDCDPNTRPSLHTLFLLTMQTTRHTPQRHHSLLLKLCGHGCHSPVPNKLLLLPTGMKVVSTAALADLHTHSNTPNKRHQGHSRPPSLLTSPLSGEPTSPNDSALPQSTATSLRPHWLSPDRAHPSQSPSVMAPKPRIGSVALALVSCCM
jgi:hypothetical protein